MPQVNSLFLSHPPASLALASVFVDMGGDVTSCYLLVELTSGKLLHLSEPSPSFREKGKEPFHTFTENL